jgi:hypothetical protein
MPSAFKARGERGFLCFSLAFKHSTSFIVKGLKSDSRRVMNRGGRIERIKVTG